MRARNQNAKIINIIVKTPDELTKKYIYISNINCIFKIVKYDKNNKN